MVLFKNLTILITNTIC